MSESEHSEELDEFNWCPAPMWIYDLATLKVLEVNDAAVRFYGYSRTDFLKMSILDIRPPEEIVPVMRSALQDHPVTGKVWRHRKQDGTIVQVRVTSTEIKFLGHPARMVHAMEVGPDEAGATQSAEHSETLTITEHPDEVVPARIHNKIGDSN